MRLLQLLSKDMKNVSYSMWINYRVYQRKFWWKTIVKKDDYYKHMRPYVDRYIEELKDEVKFLDIYFQDNDKLPIQWWPNFVSKSARARRNEHTDWIDPRRDYRTEKDGANTRAKVWTKARASTRRDKAKQVRRAKKETASSQDNLNS